MVLQWLDHHPVTLVRREGVWVFDSEGSRYLDAFSGDPAACAAAAATLEVFEADPLREGAVRVGAYLRYRLAELVAEHPLLGEVRGEGLHQTLEVVVDRHLHAPDSGVARRIASEMARRGVLVSCAGPRADLIRICPSMPFALEHVDLLVNALQEALRTVAP
jgi:4-aminobutyrate aminotransferase-like enzyme